MRRFILALIGSALISISASAQVTVSGSNVQDINGLPLFSGQWCFGATCFTVSSGSFSGSVTAGTQNVTVKNGSSAVILTVNSVAISGSRYVWDSYTVPFGTTYTGNGAPYLPCQLSAQYTQLDSSPANAIWYCALQSGVLVWKLQGPQTPAGPGLIAGVGVPTLPATVPTIYIRTDVAEQYNLAGPAGTVSSTWNIVVTSGGTVTPGSGYALSAYGSSTSIPLSPIHVTTDSTGNNLNTPGTETAGVFLPATPNGANFSRINFDAYANLTSGYAMIGDSTSYPGNAQGATDYTQSFGYKMASALNMPLTQDYAIPAAGAADCFPAEITPNKLNPGPGWGTIPSGQGWTILSLGINNWAQGTSTNATSTYMETMTACAEWMGIGRKYKTMATDPGATLAGGFAPSSPLINGGAISTTNGATATFSTVTTYGNQLHILYGIYVPGAITGAVYVSGGSVTGTVGQGCYVGTFNNSSTASGTIVLTGTNTLAGAIVNLNLPNSGGTGATAAPTTAVLTSGSATCSGTITITSTLGLGGVAGSPVPQASVLIDGSAPSSNATLFGQGVGGFNFSSILNLTTGVPIVSTIADASYPVSAGTHSVVITTQNTGAFTIGGVLSQGPLGANPPAVAIGGVLHQNLCASDSGTAAYDTLNQTLATNLQADGIIAPYVNDRSAVGCGTVDGTLANAGMSGNATTMPDGTVNPGSTSAGAHPNNGGYELRVQAFKKALALTTQVTQGATYNTSQADANAQPIQTSLALQDYMMLHSLSFVNSGAWPVFSGYNHINLSGVNGIYPWHVYFDGDGTVWNFSISPSVNAFIGGVSQVGKETSKTDLFQIKLNSTVAGKQTLYPIGNGSATEYRLPGIGSQELIPVQVDSHPGFSTTLAYNMAYSLNTTALTGNVVTMTFNMPYVTSLGGQYSTVGYCNGASPFTVAAPSNFDTTRSGYAWPFASTANFDTTSGLCNEIEVIYNQAQTSWQMRPNANVHLVNIFTMPQAMPVLNLTAAQTVVNCSTSGTATFSQPLQGSSDKKVLIHLAACNGTASYTFPTPFTNTPSVYGSNNVAATIATSVSTSAVTVTGAPSTGSMILEDY